MFRRNRPKTHHWKSSLLWTAYPAHANLHQLWPWVVSSDPHNLQTEQSHIFHLWQKPNRSLNDGPFYKQNEDKS